MLQLSCASRFHYSFVAAPIETLVTLISRSCLKSSTVVSVLGSATSASKSSLLAYIFPVLLCLTISVAVAGILIGRGLLDPVQMITHYLPELKNTAWNGATLQHVFDMTSGVKFSEEYDVRNSDIGKMDVASSWKPIPEGSDPNEYWPESVWDQMLTLKEKEVTMESGFYIDQ